MMGNQGFPDTIAFSQSQAFDIFLNAVPSGATWTNEIDVTDTVVAFFKTLESQQVNEIRWCYPRRRLYVGTSGAEYVIYAPNENAAFQALITREIRSPIKAEKKDRLLLTRALIYLFRGLENQSAQ